MKTNKEPELRVASLSRRGFLKVTGAGLTFGIALGGLSVQVFGEAHGSGSLETAIGAWVRIDGDGSIVIYNPAAEMGQGSMTALPVIVAEEMDADWSDVRIEHSPIEPDIYGRSWRPGGPGHMSTVGSRAVSGYFTKLRMAGAQIRQVLLDHTAQSWGVPRAELTTEPSVVVHPSSGRRLSYGEIAASATIPAVLPEVDAADLKSPSDFRLIGHSVPRHDIPPKTDGSAQFAIDVQVPDMLYGMIVRSPIHDGRPVSFNEAEVQAIPGVSATVRLEHGVGVIGDPVEAVLQAREALNIEWAGGSVDASFDSEASLAEYAEIPGSGQVQPRILAEKGQFESAFQAADRRYESDYVVDHIYHAQMEPLNAVVSVREDGKSAEAWVGTQSTSGARSAIAETLGIDFDRVTFHACYLGGGYGRRSNSDYVIEATQLSNAVKKPVKLMWTREDDLQYGQFRPMCLQRLSAGVNDQGDITAWNHCVVGDGGGLLSSGIEIPFYGIPHQNIERCSVSHGIRLKHWRAVGHGFNKFAIEAFLDEIAVDQGVDPYQMRRRLMRNSPRALKVLDTVAEMADWGDVAPGGRAKGIAFGERSGSLAAGIAEISVDAASGKLRVHRFWCAVDGGIIVQPDNALAQVEGGIVHGLSSVLHERVSLKNGQVQQSNFHDYSLMRMSETPEVEVSFVPSLEHPSGLGEASLPVTGGAVANAFAALTGERLRHMPFTPDRVKAVLG